MEKTLRLIARSDLNMRKGKLAAQVAHAACAQLLNAMEDRGDVWYLNPERVTRFGEFLRHPLISFDFVGSETALESALDEPEHASRIIDRGLTEFGGVRTLTCAAEGLLTLEPARHRPKDDCVSTARQWLVFSKEQPIRKGDAAVLAALGCLVQLHNLMETDGQGGLVLRLDDPALKTWLTDGFGKVALGIKTHVALDDLEKDLSGTAVRLTRLNMFGHSLLVVGPAFPDVVSDIMGRDSERYTSGLLTLL